MKIINVITFLLVVSFSFNNLSGQDVIPPESPVLEYVTINSLTGLASLKWTPSQSTDVTRYVVYTYRNSTAHAIDTLIDPYAAAYIDPSVLPRYQSVNYVVAAMDAAKNISPLSNDLGTIYLDIQTDTCNNKINLSWNACINNRHPAKGNSIYCSVNGAAPTAIDSVETGVLTYTISGYLPDSEYCFYITAFADEENISVSNRQCTTTGTQKPPSWVEISSIQVKPSEINIEGGYDSDGEITDFVAEKKHNGVWETIDSGIGAGGIVGLSDINGDTTIVNLYHISAVNSCSTKITVSKPARNILLNSSREGKNFLLRWNNPFPDEEARFTILRNIGNTYEEVTTNLNDTIYIDDLSVFASAITSGTIIYRVKATRKNDLSGSGESISSAAIEPTPVNIMMANAFTPDGDGKNDTFMPALSFTPVSFEFTILNRLGVVVFRTTNPGEGWDGHYRGELSPAGVYLWTLDIVTPSGSREKRSGTVSVLP